MSADPVRIHAWCVPRGLSTALMYSFNQRSDCEVVDEPLYAAWMEQNPHLVRPYKAELLKGERDGQKVLNDLTSKKLGKKILFCKHIAKQAKGLDLSAVIDNDVNLLVVRNPVDQLESFRDRVDGLALEEVGVVQQLELFSKLRSKGIDPIVVDAELLQNNPKLVLTEICARCKIPFDPAMLSWEAGPKPCDGMWATHWYATIHKSTGFAPYTACREFDMKAYALAEDCYTIYSLLRKKAIAGHAPLSKWKAIEDHGLLLPALPDDRNSKLFIWVGTQLVPRAMAGLSPFDSTVQGGDGCWEGFRVYDGKIFNLDPHLHRLLNSAKAMAFTDIPSADFIKNAIFRTLAANGMRDGVHGRLTLSRGEKTTSSMNPNFNVYGSKLIVVAEWKPIEGAATYDNTKGVKLITASQRRNPPQCVDSKIHHCNLINNILPKVQANNAGAADALMLDPEGFVSETNATNVFCVRSGVLITPHADFCLPGITRATIVAMAKEHSMPFEERRVSLSEFHSADEVFTTGTMGELTPVYDIDGRTIGDGERGPITAKLQGMYRELTKTQGVPLPF